VMLYAWYGRCSATKRVYFVASNQQLRGHFPAYEPACSRQQNPCHPVILYAPQVRHGDDQFASPLGDVAQLRLYLVAQVPR
jgi:hypothetical protein